MLTCTRFLAVPKLYVSLVSLNQIKIIKYASQAGAKNTSAKGTIFSDTSKAGDAYSVAFDWIAKNLYVGNRLSFNIELYKTTVMPPLRTVVLSNDNTPSGVVFPVSIAVDPNQGFENLGGNFTLFCKLYGNFSSYLFWLDEGGAGIPRKLARANMDGSEAKILVSSGLTKLDFLTLDFTKQAVYFTQSEKGTVGLWKNHLWKNVSNLI